MKKLGYIIPLVALSFLAIAPGINAQIEATPAPIIQDVGGVIGILNFVLKLVYTIFFIAAVFFILIAGFGYLTASGDPAKVKKATNRLIYGIVGVAVGLLATGVKALVANFLSNK
jgi:hypothetical protein